VERVEVTGGTVYGMQGGGVPLCPKELEVCREEEMFFGGGGGSEKERGNQRGKGKGGRPHFVEES